MNVPLVDLAAQHASIREEVMAAAGEVIERQSFILGEPVARFEETLAALCGTAHAVGVASGTDALVLALRAVGVGAGDAVVTSPLSFVATAEAIVQAGAIPIFADVDPDTLNLAPENTRAACERARQRVGAIVPVHLFGACARIEDVDGVPIVEDAAQAIGATDARGRRAGAIGQAAAFSFFPTKNLGAWGDAGAVTTNDPKLAAFVKKLRVHGAAAHEEHDEIGTNSRLDALQAAILSVKARHLGAWTEARRAAAKRYRALLASLADRLTLPAEDPGQVFHQFVVRTEKRDALCARLAERGIATRAYYKRPIHRQPAYAPFHDGRPLPSADAASATMLALPMFAEITEEQQAYVASEIVAFFATT